MFIKLLNDIYEKEQASKTETAHKSVGWRSSSLGSCLRGQFLARLLSGDFKVQHDFRTEKVFQLGNIIEDMVIGDLLKQDEWWVITQGIMRDGRLNLTGHFDALLIHKVTGDAIMFECKSKNSKAFTYMDSKHQGAMHHHKQQISSYMYMVNESGFILSPEQANLKNEDGSTNHYNQELRNWLHSHATIIGNYARQDDTLTDVWKLDYDKRILSGHILYVSKDDQRMLEYPVLADDKSLLYEWQKELHMLNYAWENKEVLPPNPIGSWQSKYCMYCKAGLCEKLKDKQVVVDLFKVVEEQDKGKQQEEEKTAEELYPF